MSKGHAVLFSRPVAYGAGSRLQDRLNEARRLDRIPDTVLFLEHRPVVTLGRRQRNEHVLRSPEELAARGIAYHVSSRGGDVTYHGPGQLVMYPILRLGESEADARGYLFNLEEIAIRTAAGFGIDAFRREGMSGAWTERGKLAAIGFHIRRWITLHGMSFNVREGLSGFDFIVGCGLVGEKVCSLESWLGEGTPELRGVREVMLGAFSGVCGRELDPVGWEDARRGWEEAGVEIPSDEELFF